MVKAPNADADFSKSPYFKFNDDKVKLKMAGTLDLNEVQLNEKLNLEIKKFKKLQAMFLGKDNPADIQKVDLRNYMKFVLKDGTILEKRSVLDCIKNDLVLKNKIITVKA